ncbi:hypothetical protein Q1695_000301 [Nippostrongylus brasiliensis]|nr:hypothetical protein Q1695_000301 [Nippostrongylus brasiliensis]
MEMEENRSSNDRQEPSSSLKEELRRPRFAILPQQEYSGAHNSTTSSISQEDKAKKGDAPNCKEEKKNYTGTARLPPRRSRQDALLEENPSPPSVPKRRIWFSRMTALEHLVIINLDMAVVPLGLDTEVVHQDLFHRPLRLVLDLQDLEAVHLAILPAQYQHSVHAIAQLRRSTMVPEVEEEGLQEIERHDIMMT